MASIVIAHEADLIADELVSNYRNKVGTLPKDWDDLRDCCDWATQGDLDCTQLDILTDCVQTRLQHAKLA